jgi:hypothetical protein
MIVCPSCPNELSAGRGQIQTRVFGVCPSQTRVAFLTKPRESNNIYIINKKHRPLLLYYPAVVDDEEGWIHSSVYPLQVIERSLNLHLYRRATNRQLGESRIRYASFTISIRQYRDQCFSNSRGIRENDGHRIVASTVAFVS